MQRRPNGAEMRAMASPPRTSVAKSSVAKAKSAKPSNDPSTPEALVDFMMKDWRKRSGELPPPIPNAAAFAARRKALSKHFPAETLARFHIEAQHPDDFLVYLLDQAPGVVCTAVKRQRASLRNPPKTAEELLATLESHALTQAVARLRQFIDLL